MYIRIIFFVITWLDFIYLAELVFLLRNRYNGLHIISLTLYITEIIIIVIIFNGHLTVKVIFYCRHQFVLS